MDPSDWDLAPKCVCNPNFISYLLEESPILSAAINISAPAKKRENSFESPESVLNFSKNVQNFVFSKCLGPFQVEKISNSTRNGARQLRRLAATRPRISAQLEASHLDCRYMLLLFAPVTIQPLHSFCFCWHLVLRFVVRQNSLLVLLSFLMFSSRNLNVCDVR